MSNPLIRPNDPRFQRPPLTDGSGNNPFADTSPQSTEPSDASGAAETFFASPAPSPDAAYKPQYATGQPSRQRLIATLVGSSLTALGCTAISIWLDHWLTYPLLLIALPTAAVGWYIAADELSVIRAGGVDIKHRAVARLGMGLGILCTLLAVGLAYTAIQQGIGLGD